MKEKALPEGWVWKRLGEVVDFFYGYPFDSSKFNDEKRGCPLIRIRDLIKQSTETYYDGEYDQSYLIEKGDILIGMDGEFNIVRWEGITALLNQRNCKLTVKSDLICEGYLFRVLISILKDIEASTPFVTVKHLSAKQLNSIYIPLPPLPVQRQIVAVLEEAEALKLQRQEADALTGALLQSVFYEMFGDPVRNEKGWEIAQLDELCSVITDGEHVTPRRTDSGIFLLSARNIQNHYISTTDVDFIDEDEYARLSKHLIPKNGDVLVSCSGTVGRVTRVNVDYKFQLVRSVALLRPIVEKFDPIYLEYIFDTQFMEDQISKCVHQSSQANLFQGMIRKLKTPLPPLALQQQFARTVEEVERIRERQVASGKEIEGLCGGLMQRAFGGELVV